MSLAQFYLFFFDSAKIFFRVFAEFLQFFCHFQIFLQDQIQGSFEFVVIDRPVTDIFKICLASQVISPGIPWPDGSALRAERRGPPCHAAFRAERGAAH